MGQSASLYRINESNFQEITEDFKDQDVYNIAIECKVFQKSFEGLRFVLSKNQSVENANLIQEIFFPEKFLGKEIDYSSLDFENIPDDYDFDSNAISYHDPEKVHSINLILSAITIEKFKELFDPNELNKNDIYPGNIWNDETSEDYAFNERHMTEEFIVLKTLFMNAKNEGDYIVSYVG